jgi:methionyl aminopeptidase
MIVMRSPREIDSISRAASVLVETHAAICRYIQPGATTLSLDRLIEEYIRDAGATPTFKGYRGFSFSATFGVNDGVVNSLPTARRLATGDIVTVGFGLRLEAYQSLQYITYPVGMVRAENATLLAVTYDALMNAVQVTRAGRVVRDISAAIQSTAEGAGFSVCRQYTGSGIGREMHEAPQIPCFADKKSGPTLHPGLVLSILSIVQSGASPVKVLKDGWSVVTADGRNAAAFSHMVAVTDGEPRILTPYCPGST